jgi:hypothetical protein
MADYRLTANDSVIRTADMAHIPNDPLNMDWQEYQRWLDAGGVPDPFIMPIPGAQYSWGPTLVEVIGQG